MMLRVLIGIALIAPCHSTIPDYSVLDDYTMVTMTKDLRPGWQSIVAAAHRIEVFHMVGQLHILNEDVVNFPSEYVINLSEYRFWTMGYDEYSGIGNTRYPHLLEFLKDVGTLRLWDDDGTWKISLNGCEADFTVSPDTVTTDNTHHWIILVTDSRIFVKLNRVLVVTLEDCDFKTWGTLIDSDMAGWELVNMEGLKTKFENLKLVNDCSRNEYRFVDTKGSLMASKELITGLDCFYDCKYTSGCIGAAIVMERNLCKLYNNNDGGKTELIEAGTKPFIMGVYPVRQYGRYNFVFGGHIVMDLACLGYKDDPCWHRDSRLKRTVFPTSREALKVYAPQDCFYDSGYTYKEIFYQWMSADSQCGMYAIDERANRPLQQIDKKRYFQFGREVYSPGDIVVDRQCVLESDPKKPKYEACYEYGVILEGDIIGEKTYKRRADCVAGCEQRENCTAWTAFPDVKSCYFYTGPVYKKTYPSGISGMKRCNEEFVSVPATISGNSQLVEPVATLLNFAEETMTLNMLLVHDSQLRKLIGYSSEVKVFTLEFYTKKMNSAWDLKITGCDNGFNYTKNPCATDMHTSNLYQLSLHHDDDETQLVLLCGESDIKTFLSLSQLTTDCGLDVTHWDGFKMINFDASDMYNLGITADLPVREEGTLAPTTTWAETTSPIN